jgi:Ca2+/Na+ antiporter
MTMNEPASRNPTRETFLSLLLVFLLGGAFAFFLYFVTLGFFSYVVGAVLGIMAVGYLHYVLWGYSFSQEVAGEREEEELRRHMEDQDPYPDPYSQRRNY